MSCMATNRPMLTFDRFEDYINALRENARRQAKLEDALNTVLDDCDFTASTVEMLADMFEPNYIHYCDPSGVMTCEESFLNIWDDWADMCAFAILTFVWGANDVITFEHRGQDNICYYDTDELVPFTTIEQLWNICTGEAAIYEKI